ncbi:FAD-binding oxidoreductase [Crocosphaera sp. UHCC 0190]|uniref:FAD-binding oxidoreductase n=1 Tax=Crocosphaera sp. UHCC 0190 TaxID=3110246 RepID=UPI002B21C42A|nr:FAD-binding oxidoreductase [Crocosphaera sp. UHCC 0190]MEA5510508.1 FAD-binding oxidoreductase [Crocosphaera sp. UHCC 0190]
MITAIASQLESLLDSSYIVPWEMVDVFWKERVKATIYDDHYPKYLITPPDLETLCKIVQLASQNQWSMLPCGNGSKLNWGGLISQANLVISTQKLNRIIDHAVSDLTVTVEAGTKLTDLQAILQPHQQFLPIDPAYPENATIGGIMATGDTGSWRQRYGGIRDLVLGMSLVRWDGKIAKAGGKVVKNVAGYDLMKLFTGSYGTLGIITEITLRLYPIPEASGTLVMTGTENALKIAAQTLIKSGFQPTAADILSASVVKTLDLGEGMGLIVRFQSIPESIKEQSTQVKVIAEKLGLKTAFYQDEIEVNLWHKLQSLIRVFNTNITINCKIGVKSNQVVNLLAKLDELTQNKGWGMINLSSGVGHIKLDLEPNLGILKQLRSLTQQYGGFLTILEAKKTIKKQFEPWGYQGNALAMMQKIKTQFDPHNLLSPRRFL